MKPEEIGRSASPFQVTREDEFQGGYVPSVVGRDGLAKKSKTRNRRRLAGGVRDQLTMGMQKAYIAALWRDGETYADIAQAVNTEFDLTGDEAITPYAINYHITAMKDYWRQKGLITIDEKQAMILARYEQLELIATDAYIASCMGKTTRLTEKKLDRIRGEKNSEGILEKIKKDHKKLTDKGKKIKTNGDGNLDELMILAQEQIKKVRRIEDNKAGDPRWLALLVDMNHKRAQLWGLLNKSEANNGELELARLSDADRESRLAAVLSMAQTRQKADKTNLATPAPLGGFSDEPVKETKTDEDFEAFLDPSPDVTEDGIEVDFE